MHLSTMYLRDIYGKRDEEEMLRKIDCVMIRVDDVAAAAACYACYKEVFGLQPRWSGDGKAV